ncbi:hypothetical protein ABPG72_005925 [Tetrahymena utriculariae]
MWNRNIVLIRKFPDQAYMQLRQFLLEKLEEKYNFVDLQIVDLHSMINNQHLLGYEVNKDQAEEIASFIKSQIISLLTDGSLINFENSIQIVILHNFIHAKFKDNLAVNKFIEQSNCICSQKINGEEIKLYYDSDLQSLKAMNVIQSNFEDKITIDDQTFRLIFNNDEISSDPFDSGCEDNPKQNQPKENPQKNKLIYQSIISHQDTSPLPPSLSNYEKQILNQIFNEKNKEDQDQQKNNDEYDQHNQLNKINRFETRNRLNTCKDYLVESDKIVQNQNTSQNISLTKIIHIDDENDHDNMNDTQKFESCKEFDQLQNTKDTSNIDKKKIRKAQSIYNFEQKPKKMLHCEQSDKQKDIKGGVEKLNPDQKHFINILLNFIVILVIYKILIK